MICGNVSCVDNEFIIRKENRLFRMFQMQMLEYPYNWYIKILISNQGGYDLEIKELECWILQRPI